MERQLCTKNKSVSKDFDPEESRYEKNLEEFGNNVVVFLVKRVLIRRLKTWINKIRWSNQRTT